MTELIIYYLLVTLLILLNGAAWVSTLFTLPGNWTMAVLSGLFYFLYLETPEKNLHLQTVVVLFILAVVGEAVEFLAGAMGASKQGASRRAMVLALVGTVVGSLVGTAVGVPVPVVGPIIGALGGGAAGAFAGAYLGESWKGRDMNQSVLVGKAALIGRLLGTFGKLIIGAIMFILVPCDLFFF